MRLIRFNRWLWLNAVDAFNAPSPRAPGSDNGDNDGDDERDDEDNLNDDDDNGINTSISREMTITSSKQQWQP